MATNVNVTLRAVRNFSLVRSRTVSCPFQYSRNLSMIPQQRVHILGQGSIGNFAAHSLAEAVFRPRITLLLHRSGLLDDYIENGSKISLSTLDGDVFCSESFDFEVWDSKRGQWYATSPDNTNNQSPSTQTTVELGPEAMIENLVVSVKASQTVPALLPLKQRLGYNSTLLFLQNGSGMVEAVNEKVFPDPLTRPNYIIGVISHGVRLNAPFNITHTGPAATSLGMVPRSNKPSSQADDSLRNESYENSSRYMIDVLCSVPRMNGKSYTFNDILQLQLEKLAVNAYSNPIGAINDTSNAFLRGVPETRHHLMTEISEVILRLPELKDVPGVKERFSVEQLEKTVGVVIEQNAGTTCSMVWDLRAGKPTEIDFINGYWCGRGREVGVRTPVNDLCFEMVKAREQKLGK